MIKSGPWPGAARKAASGGLTLGCLLGFVRASDAQQQVLAPPPAYSVTPPAMQEYETNQPGALAVEQMATTTGTQPSWSQWGPVTLHPHLLYRVLYGTGIQSAPGQLQNTVLQQFSPGVLFAIGGHWTLDYTPLFSFYSSSSFSDTVDQNVTLTWGTTYQDWVFGFTQNYMSSSGPLIQTGAQTDTQNYSTSARASYRFNGKMSVDFSVNQNFIFADQFTSTRAWSTMDWLNYDLGDRWDIGLGAGYEYDDVNPGPSMMDEQGQGRLRWRASDKLSMSVHGGAEFQQYLTDGAGTLVTPVFGASMQYQPGKTTTISLTANRNITPSLFQGQVTENTSVNLGLNQRILERLILTVGASYGRTSYESSTNVPTAGTGRVDNFYSFNVRLGTTFLKRGTAALFYQYTDNPSSLSQFSFTSSQAGIELGYRF